MNLNTLQEIEAYLSQAERLSIQDADSKPMLLVQYNSKDAKVFAAKETYLNLVEFFKGSQVLLVMTSQPVKEYDANYYRASLVNKLTADTINLDSVLWHAESLTDLLNIVSPESKIELVITVHNPAQTECLAHPLVNSHKPMIIDGYNFNDNNEEEFLDKKKNSFRTLLIPMSNEERFNELFFLSLDELELYRDVFEEEGDDKMVKIFQKVLNKLKK